MRNRTYDNGAKVWRMGDIVYSSPTVVGAPSESYHLIYRDRTYGEFVARYGKRRTVVYAGANDGMIHAFNGGFYDSSAKEFKTTIPEPYVDRDQSGTFNTGDTLHDWSGDANLNNTTNYDLGSELWAYIPYNLLPHLYWLTQKDYPHVYYNDLKPRVFDAKIFYNSAGTPLDADHPNGWGTVMAVGMRLGGGKVRADMDKTDGNTYNPNVDRTMRSAIVLFDVTNPEKAPKVIGEIALEGQGYTTCYPAVLPMRSKSGSGSGATYATNDWYLVFGSGPANAAGEPATGSPLTEVISQQTGKMFIVDLRAMVQSGEVRAVNNTGTMTTLAGNLSGTATPWYFDQYDANTYISQPLVLDYNLDFNADVAYFGTVSGSRLLGWGGTVRRLVFDERKTGASTASNVVDISNWHDSLGVSGATKSNSILMDLASIHQPVSAPISMVFDAEKLTAAGDHERWIFFGTGRNMTREDSPNTDQQSFYGIREPSDTAGFTWDSVTRASLLDTSDAIVYTDKTVEGISGVTDWSSLMNQIDNVKSGWYFDFPITGEKSVGDATIIGGLALFMSYAPSQEICNSEGDSYLRMFFYKTGTAYFKPAFGTRKQTTGINAGKDVVETTSKFAGMGVDVSAVSVGDGSVTATVSLDDGSNRQIKDIQTPYSSSSNKTGWRERR